jgi:hypothetical protein
MKNTFASLLHRLVCALTLTAAGLLVCPAALAATTNMLAKVPVDATNQLAIGSPAIIVPPAIAKSLNLGAAGSAETDGALATDTIRRTLEHLLRDSGRFQIFEGGSAGYKIQAGVASYRIASDSAASTNKESFFKGASTKLKGMFSKSTATNQLGGLDLVSSLNDINWSKD